MASNLTSQVSIIAELTTAVAIGDLSRNITVDVLGEILELKNTINIMVDQLNSFASEVTRVAREVGTEGKLGGQANVPGVAGTWKDLTDNVNSMAGNLTSQVRNIAAVTTAVANGDLSKKITVDVRGEIFELKDTINIMVDQLSSFASEVTRVAREVGTEGKLGGQAEVKGVAGTWKDLTDNVNSMAGNLTGQVRGIAKVVTAVANGDLNQKLSVEAKGEIAALADTINGMIDTLATFADQVTTVAREVGVEGRLGGQASVPGAAGTWKDLTDNVNQLAANLTTQVRAIAEVATAVTEGDLTRSIRVEAEGEVAALKDNINQMIANLRETTLKNSEQDWLKTNLAKFSRMLQGQKDLLTVARMILSELAPLVSASHGVFYSMDAASRDNAGTADNEAKLKLLASYAYRERKTVSNEFRLGEGLVGQSALEKERILLTNVPGDYIQINSGLGAAPPYNIVVLPVVFEDEVKAVIELASFERFSPTHQVFLDQLTESIGIVLNTIEANMRTESLLDQSQSLARELQSRQEELQQTNEELADKAQLLAQQNAEVERKNREVEQAKQDLEDKAEQLALTSRYKSEFMANMSHELRTPLNSLLILSQQLAENPDGNLSDKQVEYARTIQSSGSDLLTLINDILDLSKIESGTTSVEVTDVTFSNLQQFVDRTFRYLAESKGLDLDINLAPDLQDVIYTDATRLQQVLKNLVSNAIKFTDKGNVTLDIAPATSGWSRDQESLNTADAVVAFSVRDTGIGIPLDRQHIIFEPFQQADGTTSRKYGGTGLGLSISREIARLLGGEIRFISTPDVGSTFTLYLPHSFPAVLNTRSANAGTAESPAPVEFLGNGHAERAIFAPSSQAGWFTPTLPRELAPPSPAEPLVDDDRAAIGPRDRVLLIIEDDANFATVLLDRARASGFKGLVATSARTALSMVDQYKPHAITLDLHLPDGEGWHVLDHLKSNPNTRHIPVHMITVDEERERGLLRGALAFLTKPVTKEALDAALADLKRFVRRRVRKLLVVGDDEAQRKNIIELIGSTDVKSTAVANGAEALAALKAERFDCMVLDLSLSDMTGFQLIDQLKKEPGLKELPVIVYTGRDLTRKEETRLKRASESIIVKGAQSPERLLDETSLYLHRVSANLPPTQRKMLEQLHHPDATLAGKKVLLVDDDIRNLFAMTSVLERFKMNVLTAENGHDAIALLKRTRDIDILLLDIMMPDMDGFHTLTAIRAIPRLKSLPIIVVTAKAMKGDREKCIEAGASDYIAKPLDTADLLLIMRRWLETPPSPKTATRTPFTPAIRNPQLAISNRGTSWQMTK
jgi:signal transduction histidine kinase/CheY-like chemotaxis protein/HAMP domain-containing protein